MNRRATIRKSVQHAAIWCAIACLAAIAAIPFIWMLLTALKTHAEATAAVPNLFPRHWQFNNIVKTFRAAPFARYFFNSFLVGAIVTASVVFTSLMAGYAFARLRFPGRSLLFGLVLATMMIPFEITLIPNFVLITRLQWYNTYYALIVPWCANAFSVFLMRQAFMALPRDYFDAAAIDGCGHIRFLIRIAAPLVKPTAVTVGLFAFLGSYNALLWPLVVTGDPSMGVVQVGLTVFAGAESVRVHLLMCASLIVILPTIALYFAAQRYFMESALGTGIKG